MPALERGAQRGDRLRLRGARLRRLGKFAEHVAHALGRRHDRVHQLGGERHLAVPELVEQVLGQVAERHELGGVEETGAALDRMKTAEDVVQQAPVVGRPFEIDELVIDVGEQVARLLQEVLQQVLHPGKVAHLFPP